MMETNKILNTIKWISSFAAILWVLTFLFKMQLVEPTAGDYALIALLVIWLTSAVLYATHYIPKFRELSVKIKPYADLYPIITSVVFAVFIIYFVFGLITVTGAWTLWDTLYWIIHPIIIFIGLMIHTIQNVEVI